MAGLSHFNTAKAAVSLYEPVYLNQFEVILQPPPAVFNPAGNAGRSLLIENLISLSVMAADKTPVPVTQTYKFSQRRYAGGAVEDTGVKLKLEFETNLDETGSNYVFKTLRQWADLVYNPLTGAMGIKSTYANNAYLLVNIFNREGEVFRQLKFLNVFPIEAITSQALSYESGQNLYKISMTFRADWFTDIFN
jgi:hypothetical protein